MNNLYDSEEAENGIWISSPAFTLLLLRKKNAYLELGQGIKKLILNNMSCSLIFLSFWKFY